MAGVTDQHADRNGIAASYRSWSGPSRAMAVAVDAAVTAAQAPSRELFDDAISALRRLDQEQVAVLLGAITRDLLERSHPNGLDSDDAEEVVRSCLVAVAPWYEPLDGNAVVLALTGALGVNDPDESTPPDRGPVLTHGLLLIADLLTVAATALAPVLDRALGELRRAQTIELP